jgi:hypothetical protein
MSQWIQRRYLDNERVKTDLPTCIKRQRAAASRLRERSRRVTATKTNRPYRRREGTASLFIPPSTATVLILPVPATSCGSFKDYLKHLVWRA